MANQRRRGSLNPHPGYEAIPDWFAAFQAAANGRTVEDFGTGEQLTCVGRQFRIGSQPIGRISAVAFCLAGTGRLIAPTA